MKCKVSKEVDLKLRKIFIQTHNGDSYVDISWLSDMEKKALANLDKPIGEQITESSIDRVIEIQTA